MVTDIGDLVLSVTVAVERVSLLSIQRIFIKLWLITFTKGKMCFKEISNVGCYV